jgi:hypothetical protein
MIPGIPGQGSPEAEGFSMGFSMAISTNPYNWGWITLWKFNIAMENGH